jgi:hypothetical protein
MIRPHHTIKTAVTLSALAAGLLVAGCGGASSSGKAAGVNPVRAAYISSHGPGYQVAIKVTGTAGGRAIHVIGAGAFDRPAHAGRLTLNVSSPTVAGESFRIAAVIRDQDFYLKMPASIAGSLPGAKPWLELNLADVGKRVGMPGLSSLADSSGGNPAEFLQFLRAASTGSVQNLGRQTIDGHSTTHMRATVDLSKVVDTLPAPRRPRASSAIAALEKLTGLHYLPMEAWVDPSDHVRRMVLSENGQVAGQAFSERVQLDFVKYAPEPVPAAPPAHEVTNIMSLGATS